MPHEVLYPGDRLMPGLRGKMGRGISSPAVGPKLGRASRETGRISGVILTPMVATDEAADFIRHKPE